MESRKMLLSVIGSLIVVGAITVYAEDGPSYSHTEDTVISSIRLIDGLGNEPIENQDIVVVGGKITAIGPSGSVEVPANTLKIDGKGLTALPGLMDLHIHTQGGWANGLIPGERYEVRHDDASVQQRMSGYVYAGVTTVLDVGADHKWVLNKKNQINNGEIFGPRFFTTGAPWSQTPSGWESGNTGDSDFGLSTKVYDLANLPEQVARYKKDGIEIIKLYAGISTVAMQALITEAHKHDMLTISDLWMLNFNREIAQTTGLDGWAHTGGFAVAPQADHEWMAKNNHFVIGTANVGEKLAGLRVKEEDGKRLMLKEPLIVDIWGRDEVNHFYDVYPKIREAYYEGPQSFYQLNNFGDLTIFRQNMLENIKRSYDAGVLVACGTDDVYASLWPGESTHREMELLVKAGIPNLDVIKACTSDSAKVLRREDKFGSLQVGMSADILLVEGNPAANISDSRKVRYVFMRGKLVDRNSLKIEK